LGEIAKTTAAFFKDYWPYYVIAIFVWIDCMLALICFLSRPGIIE